MSEVKFTFINGCLHETEAIFGKMPLSDLFLFIVQ